MACVHVCRFLLKKKTHTHANTHARKETRRQQTLQGIEQGHEAVDNLLGNLNSVKRALGERLLGYGECVNGRTTATLAM